MAREDEQIEKFKRELNEALDKSKQRQAEEQAAKRLADNAHIKAAIAAKIDPNLDAEDITRAKSYVRARNFFMLRKACDVLEMR